MKPISDLPDAQCHPQRPDEASGDGAERALLTAVANGDRVAFQRLYTHYYTRLIRFLTRHTSRRDLLDEIINDVFWIVWRKAPEFRGDSKVGTWIIGIAYRCMLKTLRFEPASRESAEFTDDDMDGGCTDTPEAEQRELRDWVMRGLATLPPEQRMTLELAYYLGQSCEEIAAIMNCAVGTVKARMFHARLRLRNTLPAIGGDTAVPVRFPESAP
ncbi:RNA polymerase sigma factor [Tahibacter amnicola]|uniref:Sigma-70 family RNA polymerase sigma factor n=1 Tax=Tahibacter amnicola TaxID=2976241 RepID=A0ABY6B936_9GAMM|nr:sigma-70 family RNA polymerase sigma factor [Tahibacter amnicola]UXI66514.1 sigma-70 family RNA polymerase sigma factor [Tahibacter amnicola]